MIKKTRNNISYIVLHYQTVEDTLKCIDSIKVNNDNAFIVIVDNASPNGSGKQLSQIFLNDSKVKVILNETNVGFSIGNNIGCKYAIKHFNPNFLCVLNNDVFIRDTGFESKVLNSYNKSEFDIMGMVVISMSTDKNQSPIKIPANVEEIKAQIEKIEKYLQNNNSPIKYFFTRLSYKIFKKGAMSATMPLGAILIFSKKYFGKYQNVFPEYTSFYYEETLLYYRKIKDNLIVYFDNDISVDHKDGSATKASAKEGERIKIGLKRGLDALYKVLKVFEEDLPI